jgi:hypothetical protein
MIFFLRSTMSVVNGLDVRKFNAHGWTLIFRAFIYEPFVDGMARMATKGSWDARPGKNIVTIPRRPDKSLGLEFFVEFRNSRRMI